MARRDQEAGLNLHDDLDAISEKWWLDARVVKPSLIPDVLYHYTDAAGLAGMLANGTVWTTDYRFLNDKSEFIHTRSVVKRVMDEVGFTGVRAKAKDALDAAIERYQLADTSEDAFVFSLSEHKDDLSQWRGYARDGMGFTIGFDASELHRVSLPDEGRYTFSKIEYDEERQFSALKKAYGEFIAVMTRDRDGSDSWNKTVSDAGRLFDWTAASRGALNKHASFAGEREWRVLHYAEKSADGTLVRASGLRLVPYRELALHDTGEKLPVVSIGIGPGFTEAAIGDAVRTLARQHGYDVDVYFAETPYRRV